MWHGPMQGNWLSGFGIGMMILMLLFWLLVIAGVVFLIWFIATSLRQGQQEPPRASPETPLEILKRRLASGEITTDEYQDLRRTLED